MGRVTYRFARLDQTRLQDGREPPSQVQWAFSVCAGTARYLLVVSRQMVRRIGLDTGKRPTRALDT